MALSKSDSLVAIEVALKLLRHRMRLNSTYGVYVHANEQLEGMLKVLASSASPNPSERDVVDIGVMAVRELEAEDPELADALMLAAYNFKHLT